MEAEKVEGLDVGLDGHRVRCSFAASSVGAYQVVLVTVLPDRGIELHSSYTGHPNIPESVVTHLELAPGRRTIDTRRLRAIEVPVVWGRRRCLFDHLARLADLIRECGYESATIAYDDELVLALEGG
jgi:hypothetical protein